MARKEFSRRNAIIIALVVSLLLFFAGVISGLSASKLSQQRAQEEFSFLIDYVNGLGSDLQSLQIQEAFVSSLDESERCQFAETYFRQIAENLEYYWRIFPSRLEQYEQGRDLSPDYLRLKEDYTRLSLRAWLVARRNYQQCQTTTVPILYFYSSDCSECVQQGVELDKAKERMGNATLLVFALDLGSEEQSLRLVEKYYGVTQPPALIIDTETLQGRLFTEEEILATLGVEPEETTAGSAPAEEPEATR